MTTGKALDGKLSSGNTCVRPDEGEIALTGNAESCVFASRTKKGMSTILLFGFVAAAVSATNVTVAYADGAGLENGVIYRNDFTHRVSEYPIPRLGETYTATPYTTGKANLFSYLSNGGTATEYGFDFFGVYRMLDFSWWYASNVYGNMPSQDGWFQPDWLYGGATTDPTRPPVYHHQAGIFRLNDDPCFRFWYSTATARAGLALHSLHNVFTSGVLRVQYDMRAPQRWDTSSSKPVIVFPVFDKYMRSSAWNSGSLTWDCLPGAAGLRSGGDVKRAFPQYYDEGFNRSNLGDTTRQLGNNYSGSGSSEKQVHWFRFVLDYNLDTAHFSGTVKSLEALHALDAYDSEAHPTFDTATTSAKNNTIESSLWLGCATNSTGALTTDMTALWAEKGGLSGIGIAAGMTTTMGFSGDNVISNKVFIDNIRVAWKAPGATDFAVAYENDFETRTYTTLSAPATTECAYSATTSAVDAFDVFNGYELLSSTGSNVGPDARVVPSSTGAAYSTTLQPTGIDGWRRVYSPDANAISTPFAYSGYSGGVVETSIAFCNQQRYACIGNLIGEKVTTGRVRVLADAYLPLAPDNGAYKLPPDGYGRIGIGIGTEAMYTALQAGHSAEVAACCGFLRTREEGVTNDYAYAAGPDATVTPSATAIGTKGSWYRLALTVDMDARTYDASITPIGATTVADTATLAESPIYAVYGVALAANIANLASFYLWGYGYGDTVKWNEDRRGAFTNIRIAKLDSQGKESRVLYVNNFDMRKRVAIGEPRASSHLAYHYDCPDGADAWVRRNGGGQAWGGAIGTVRDDGGNQFLSLGRESGDGERVIYTTPLDRIISNQTFTVRVDMRPPMSWTTDSGRFIFGVGNKKMEQSQIYDSDSGRFVRFGFSCFDPRTSDVCFNTNIAFVAYDETGSRVKLAPETLIDTSHWYRFIVRIDPDAQTYKVRVYDKGETHPALGGDRGTLVAQSEDIRFCGAKGEGACALDLYVCGAGNTVGETGLDPMQAAVDNIEVRLALGAVILVR